MVLVKTRVELSFMIKNEYEKCNKLGINCVQCDWANNILFSGGRDSFIRKWDIKDSKNSFIGSMEHHIDWVNDIILCCNSKYLISSSNDTTVKVWNAQKCICMSTLRTHKDYVKCLAYASEKEIVASAGFDQSIFLWDIKTLASLTPTNNLISTNSLDGCKSSIYSISMNDSASLLCAGCFDGQLILWDPRTCIKIKKFLAHSDTIKSIVINSNGSECISTGSDGVIKHWSLREQKCISSYECHVGGVWTLQTNSSFSNLYSSGKDGKVFLSDLKHSESTPLCLLAEEAPVLKILLNPKEDRLWVCSVLSTIKEYALSYNDSYNKEISHSTKIHSTIKGSPGIHTFHILDDKRHILTKDLEKRVCLWDVLTASKVKDLGNVDFDEEIERRKTHVYIPQWFTAELKTGFLTIHLEENDCFSAWIFSSHIGLSNEARNEELFQDYGFTLPSHLPLAICEGDGKMLYRFTIKDLEKESEDPYLTDLMPYWICDAIIRKEVPKSFKIPFYLQPHPSLSIKSLKRDRLHAVDMVLVQKIVEYLNEKVLLPSKATSNSHGCTNNQNRFSLKYFNSMKKCSLRDEMSKDEDDMCKSIQLYCSNQVLPLDMDLRSVKHFIWKDIGDLVLYYNILKCNA